MDKWRKTSKEVVMKSKAVAGMDSKYLEQTEFLRIRKTPVYIPTENPFVFAKKTLPDSPGMSEYFT